MKYFAGFLVVLAFVVLPSAAHAAYNFSLVQKDTPTIPMPASQHTYQGTAVYRYTGTIDQMAFFDDTVAASECARVAAIAGVSTTVDAWCVGALAGSGIGCLDYDGPQPQCGAGRTTTTLPPPTIFIYTTAPTVTAAPTFGSYSMPTPYHCAPGFNNYCVEFKSPKQTPPPTANLSASATSVTIGQSSSLTYTCTNATSASISPTVGAVTVQTGTRSVTPTTTTTYTLTCTGVGGSATDTVTVTYVPQSDLRAGTTDFTAQSSSPYVWAGQAFTYTSTVTNGGQASGTSFPNSFQFSTGTRFAANTITTLAASASAAMSGSYTIATPGSYSLRACADTNTSGVGTESESNETNNCGAYMPFSVAPAAPTGMAATCNANGTQVTLSWNATAGASYYLLRMTMPSTGSCPTGWVPASWDATKCITNPDSVSGTSLAVTLTPGTSVGGWWTYGSLADGTWGPAGAGPGFTCSGAPDLTAGSVTPTSATQGTAVNLSSTLSNVGNVTTGTSFTNLWQFDADTDHTTVSSTKTDVRGPIAAGGTAVSQVSNTFASSGTWYARVCADNNAAFADTITESNEGNNCGPWTAIAVAAPAPTATLNATPSTVLTGAASLLTWSSTNAASCTGTGFSTGGAANNVVGVSTGALTTTTTNYSINCGGAVSNKTVTVIAPTATIAANPDRVNPGATTTLTWSSSQCDTVAITGTNGFASVATSSAGTSSGAIGTHGSTFTITCLVGGVTAATAQADVNVPPNFEEF